MPTFATPTPIAASVDVMLGDIRFVALPRTDTVVAVRPVDPARKLDVEAAMHTTIEYADGRLSIRQPRLKSLFPRRYGSVRVLVELPAGSDVAGNTAEGECVVQGTVGSCRLTNAIGDIRVARAADVRLRTACGRVIVEHVAGAADIHANGEVRVRRVDGQATIRNDSGGHLTLR